MIEETGERLPDGEASSAAAPLFLVLEGGGAKGIAHVAAWAALEAAFKSRNSARRRFVVQELAGTSAGAMAAAAIAAGARSEQLIDEEGRIPLASALGIEAFYDLFGIAGWRRLRVWRFLLQPSKSSEKIASRFCGEDRQQRKVMQNVLKEAQKRVAGNNNITKLKLFTRLGYVYRTGLDWWSVGATIVKSAFLLFGLALIGFLIEHLVRLGSTAFALYVVFWAISAILLSLSAKIARDWDAARAEEGRGRHASLLLRCLTNPAYNIAFAFALTFVSYWVIPFQSATAIIYQTLPRPLLSSIIYLFYAFCLVLALWTVGASIRGVLKGVIKTGDLRKDINKALVTLMTREEKFVAAEDRYEWVDKTPRSTAEGRLFERLRQPGHLVTFGDLEQMTGRKLSIVTADTINSRIHIYSTRSHWNHDVGTAIASSVAIPLAFRPMRTASTMLVDGGIVSSIPAWIFRRNRTRDPDARILAVGIAPTGADEWIPLFLRARDRLFAASKIRLWARMKMSLSHPWASILWPWQFVSNVMYTTAYGGRSLDLESSDRLDAIELGCTFHLMDFDRKRNEVALELRTLREEAAFWIDEKLWGQRETFYDFCKEIEHEIWRRAQSAGYSGEGRIRIIWAEREARVESLRIKEAYGFAGGELSDRLTLSFDSSVVGFSAAMEKCHFADEIVLKAMFASRRDRYRQVYRWREMKWCWTIPIFAPKSGRLAGVLGIQCDISHGFLDPDLKSEADLRAAQWKDPNGKIRRNSDNTIALPIVDTTPDTPQMEALEKLWAERFRQEYLNVELPKILPAVVDARARSLR